MDCYSDEDNNVNKVKTALLTIQKDFENRLGFSPIVVRPIPLFSQGLFQINEMSQRKLNKLYPDCIKEINSSKHICKVQLDKIWEKKYSNISFPKFKYLVYSKASELDNLLRANLNAVLYVSINFADDYNSLFDNLWDELRKYINQRVVMADYIYLEEIAEVLATKCSLSKFKAESICEVVVASMSSYRQYQNISSSIVKECAVNNGKIKYQFNVAVNSFFNWVKKIFETIKFETKNGELYLLNDGGLYIKGVSVVLGILESIGVLSFNMIGGANSQLYIYINQIQNLKNIINNPANYKNKLLETVSEKHLISVKMLTYIYEGEFSNNDIWNILEDYFLGVIPEEVKTACLIEKPQMNFGET